MNAEQYLKTEFNVQPAQYRDVANFLVKEQHKKEIENPIDFLRKIGSAQADKIKVEKVVSSGSTLYKASTPDSPNVPPQRTASIAVWTLLASKNQTALNSNPLVDSEKMESKKQKWATHSKELRQEYLIKWLADIELMISVWQAHKKSQDYIDLPDNDKDLIDSIGVLQKLLRKSAVLDLADEGVFLSDESVREQLSVYIQASKKDRKQHYPKYQSSLTPVFRFKIKEVLEF